jgi:hypothetical protein
VSRKLTEVASRLAAKAEPKREVIYIVDFENIPKTDVAGLLRKKNVVMVVLAANRTNTVTRETLTTIEANPERVDVIIGRITRKEFVDKLVTAKIGEYAFRFPEAEIIVLANDKDYADLATHLNDHWERTVPIKHVAPAKAQPQRKKKPKAPVAEHKPTEAKPKPTRTRKRIAKPEVAKEEAPKAKPTRTRRRIAKPEVKTTAPTKPITNPDAEAVRDLLANLPKHRLPKSGAALLNAVRNYRESVGLKSRPSTIVKHLEECGVIDATTTPVTYLI